MKPFLSIKGSVHPHFLPGETNFKGSRVYVLRTRARALLTAEKPKLPVCSNARCCVGLGNKLLPPVCESVLRAFHRTSAIGSSPGELVVILPAVPVVKTEWKVSFVS